MIVQCLYQILGGGMKRILVTGALGQIGSELVPYLRRKYGVDSVIASDLRRVEGNPVLTEGVFETLDVMDAEKFKSLAQKHKVDTIIHMAALLSATAEKNPSMGWNLNMGGLVHALEICRELGLSLFTPSSIAAFGPGSPPDQTPQDTVQRPTTMYGVTKVAGELLCDYYHAKYGVDTRGVRFPGLISSVALPGGGTTDYAVEIYYEAVEKGKYASYIGKGTYMDMMYMPDALKCIVDLMEADASKLKHRNAFNVSAMSFEPEEIARSIKKAIPHFEMSYNVDPMRQKIAESWPNSINCDAAKSEWGFSYEYDLDKMTNDMIKALRLKLSKNN